jgi:hypothetical protein
MDKETKEGPAGFPSNVTEPSSCESTSTSSPPASIGDKVLTVLTHPTVESSKPDMGKQLRKEEELKTDNKTTIVGANYDAAERPEKEDSDRNLDHLSNTNSTAAGPSGGHIAKHILSSNLEAGGGGATAAAAAAAEEDDDMAGSLDVGLAKYGGVMLTPAG